MNVRREQVNVASEEKIKWVGTKKVAMGQQMANQKEVEVSSLALDPLGLDAPPRTPPR